MELTLTSALSLFLLIALSTGVFFASKRLKVPYTVLLVFVGLLLVPIVNLPVLEKFFGFIDDLVLTPELLFYIFLPVLIFESAFNMNMRKMLDSAWTISLLSVVSLLVSAALTATALYFVMPLIGVNMPLIVALLFGAVISPTDPVAALSLFRELGVPRRLSLIFEGESLMNDGTAVALFLVVLSVALEGFHGAGTLMQGGVDFIAMIVLGVLLGLVMAAIFSKTLNFTKENEFVTVTLLIISAHLVFITAELINHSGIVHVSSIIATTVAALFLGNYSRHVLDPQVDKYLGKLIEHMAFVINSLVFLMAGLLFAGSGVDFVDLWLPIAVTVLIVASARAISVLSVTRPLNWLKLENRTPPSWEKLLAWASLRGALSIIIVLMIPADFMVEGWTYGHTPRDFLLALTIGCILATLFIKAPLIGPIMRKLRINEPDPLKEAHEADLAVYFLLSERAHLYAFGEKRFITDEHRAALTRQVEQKLQHAQAYRRELLQKHGKTVFEQSLHLSMVHIEKRVIRRLYNNSEVTERTYRKISSKLALQQEKIECAQHHEIDPSVYTDRKDIFDRLVGIVLSPFGQKGKVETLHERMEYYRAQMIMARKAVMACERMQKNFEEPVFLPEYYAAVIGLYKRYQERSGFKMNALVDAQPETLAPHLRRLAERALAASGNKALTYLDFAGLLDEATQHSIEAQYALRH